MTPVRVIMSSMSVPICNYFHAGQANSKKKHFLRGYPFLRPSCAGLIECRRLGLELLKSTFNGKNFTCLGLSPTILAQFTLEMCVAARNCEKFTKTPNFEGSRSFKVIDADIPKKPVISACYDKQHVCVYLQPDKPVNSGKIMSLWGECPLSPPRSRTPITERHEILSHENTKDSKLSYGDNPKSLSHLVLEQYRDVTDRHQDRITIANMRYS